MMRVGLFVRCVVSLFNIVFFVLSLILLLAFFGRSESCEARLGVVSNELAQCRVWLEREHNESVYFRDRIVDFYYCYPKVMFNGSFG